MLQIFRRCLGRATSKFIGTTVTLILVYRLFRVHYIPPSSPLSLHNGLYAIVAIYLFSLLVVPGGNSCLVPPPPRRWSIRRQATQAGGYGGFPMFPRNPFRLDSRTVSSASFETVTARRAGLASRNARSEHAESVKTGCGLSSVQLQLPGRWMLAGQAIRLSAAAARSLVPSSLLHLSLLLAALHFPSSHSQLARLPCLLPSLISSPWSPPSPSPFSALTLIHTHLPSPRSNLHTTR